MKKILLITSCILSIGILSYFIAGCKKESESNQQTSRISIPSPTPNARPELSSSTDGFGHSKKPLTGTLYVFPAGVTMNGSITTNENFYLCNAYYESLPTGTLPFYMSLWNHNNTPTTIIFPAGLVLPCSDTTIQGAILVQSDTFTIPANSALCVNLNAECINDTRTFNENQTYDAPLITNNHNFLPLIQLLAHKQTITYDPNEVIQHTVWSIADSNVITPDEMAAINAFP